MEGGTFGLLGAPIAAAMPIAGAGVKIAWQNFKGRAVPEIARRLGISNDAAKVVRKALENDDLDAAARALDRAGSTSMLADAGPATQQLLDVSITAGGTAPRIAREAIDARAVESGARMNQVLDDTLGSPEGTDALRRNIREETSLSRDITYKDAYSQPINYAGRRGRHLENLMRRVPKSAIDQANNLMRLEGVQSQQILADIAADGSITFSRLPDVRQLDYITRALGDVADAQNAAGKLGGTTQLGRATQNLARDVRQTLRNEVPAYGVALDTAADAINRSNAVLLGSSILAPSTTREMVRDGLKGAGKTERDAAKAGLRSAIDEKLANVSAVASDSNTDIREFQKMANELRSRAMRDNMESLLGGSAATRLYNELDEQVVSLELRAAVARNSATARRQAIQGQVEDITAPGIFATLLGDGPEAGPVNATKRVVAALAGNTAEARALRKMGIYDEIANALVNTRGPQAQQALRLVERAMAGEALSKIQARTIARAMTTPAAMAIYAAEARPETESQQPQPYSLPTPAPAPAPAPTPPPQARVQPPAAKTRGVPALEQAGEPAGADLAAAGPAGGQPDTQSRQMLQDLYPFDDILRLG
jgi:lipase chaperone LimK